MTTPEAFAYLIPGLVRLALLPPHEHWGWYGDRLAFQLRWGGRRNQRWQFCTPAMRAAAAAALEHIVETRNECIEQYDSAGVILDAFAIWSDAGD
jgi:hypothetical protein